ncbi:MAG TPA: hypothetical protein VFI05_11955 [Nitrospiraceae bacterium]|nr:hypothetical protein [Nitrospiraceae bacterium]
MMTTDKLTVVGVLGMVIMMAGCANETALRQLAAPDHSSAPQLSAEDHRTVARLYQREAARLDAAAQQYQKDAAELRPEEDPKGNRRAGLQTALGETRRRASNLMALAAGHQGQAQTTTGQQGRE